MCEATLLSLCKLAAFCSRFPLLNWHSSSLTSILSFLLSLKFLVRLSSSRVDSKNFVRVTLLACNFVNLWSPTESDALQSWSGFKPTRLTEENCSAEEDGGGLYISKHSEGQTSPLGRLEFHNCSAGGRGGGVFIEGKDGAEFMARQMYFHHCRADREGGAFFAERMSQLDHVTLDLCNSGGSGAMTVYNDVNVSDLTVVTDADSKGQAIMSGGATVVESLNCTGSGEQMCEVASSTNLSLPNLWCPDGAERKDTDRPQKVACSLCGNGYVRLIQAVNPQCQPCPPQATQCVPTKLTMPAGMTVDANNFSLELYCPNPAACPGGYLLASSN